MISYDILEIIRAKFLKLINKIEANIPLDLVELDFLHDAVSQGFSPEEFEILTRDEFGKGYIIGYIVGNFVQFNELKQDDYE